MFDFRFLFNDAEVKQFDPSQIATECFGGEMTVSALRCFSRKFIFSKPTCLFRTNGLICFSNI